MRFARGFYLVLAAVLVVGCGGASNIGTAAPTAAGSSAPSAAATDRTATASASAAPSSTATAEPTASASPSAPTEGTADKAGEWFKACQSSTYARVEVVLTVVNNGGGWVDLDAGSSDYTIYDKSDNVMGTGSFTYTFPRYLAPGQVGYLADETVIDNAKAANVKRIETSGQYKPVDASDVVALTTGKTTNKPESYGGGVHTTGTITNKSSATVASAHVGAFYLDASGRLLGYSYTNLIENLGAGKTKGYDTGDSWCPLKMSAIKKTVVLAGNSY